MTLYKDMGFEENPFARFSAEEELSYLTDIFIEPKFFATILSDITCGSSRYIFGERGSGKSALMFKLISELQKKGGLIALVDSYAFVLERGNAAQKRYITLLLRTLVRAFVQDIIIKGGDIKSKLNDSEMEKISFLVQNFYSTISSREMKKFQTTHKIYDAISPIANSVLSGAVALTSDTISKSLGLPQTSGEFYREYFPSLKDKTREVDVTIITEDELLLLVENFMDLMKKIGYVNVVVFFDKIDEEQEIAGKIDMVVKMLLPIMLNNKVLLNSKFPLIFLLWSKLKWELNASGVRFDKIKPIDVSWSSGEIYNMMDKRIKHFSGGTNTFEGIFYDKKNIDVLLRLANGSPRDLLRLLSAIYDQQENMKSDIKILTNSAISKGILTFLSEYDFYSIYPAQRGSKQDIKGIISKLRNLGKTTFAIKELAAVLKVGYQSGNSYVKIMKNYGVIEENQEIAGREKEYNICDPKIEFIIKNNISLK